MNTCYNPFSLVGKTVLVTGASSGIGRATAIECSKMGARLIITARNEKRLSETLLQLEGEGHRTILAELTDQEQLNNLVKESGKIDGIAYCAGINFMSPLKFATKDKIDYVFNPNLFAPIELVRSFIKKKQINPGGSIAVVSSISGVTRCGVGNGIYGSAKSALTTWMKFLAKEIGSKNIRANSICPGMVETPLIHDGPVTEAELEADKKRYPIQRYCRPEEIGYAMVYFLSDASAWVTGTNFIIDGGKSI